MRIVLIGVGCVGKSTVGKLLAEALNYKFIDFDFELEKRLGNSIERLKNQHFNGHGFRTAVKPIFGDILDENKDNLVMAMPLDGMRQQFTFTLKKYHPDVITVVLRDRPENIMNRLVFYDEDTKLIEEEVLNDTNYAWYLRDLKQEISYHKKSYFPPATNFPPHPKKRRLTPRRPG